MSVQRRNKFILPYNWVWQFDNENLRGLKLTRETPPGECSRKVKLKGIDGDLYKGWRCGLIRIPRKTLPIFVSGLASTEIINIEGAFLTKG